MMALVEIVKAIGMILLCLLPVVAVGVIAAWSSWEQTHK